MELVTIEGITKNDSCNDHAMNISGNISIEDENFYDML